MLALSCPVDCRWGANADECHKKLQKENSQKAFPPLLPQGYPQAGSLEWKEPPCGSLIPVQTTDEKRTWSHLGMTGVSTTGRESCFRVKENIFFGRTNIHRLKNMWLFVGNTGFRDDSQVPAPIHHKKTEVNIMNKVCVQPFYWTLLMSTCQSWLALLNHGKQDTETGNYMKR